MLLTAAASIGPRMLVLYLYIYLLLVLLLLPQTGVLNHIQVAALFVRLTKLASNKQLRPRDMLALPSMLPQVCLYLCVGGTRCCLY